MEMKSSASLFWFLEGDLHHNDNSVLQTIQVADRLQDGLEDDPIFEDHLLVVLDHLLEEGDHHHQDVLVLQGKRDPLLQAEVPKKEVQVQLRKEEFQNQVQAQVEAEVVKGTEPQNKTKPNQTKIFHF